MPSSIEVNGQIISHDEIRAEMTAIREDAERRGVPMGPDERMHLRERAIESLIERTVILQEIERLKLMPTLAEIQHAAAAMVPRVDGATGCRAGVDVATVEREAAWKLASARIVDYWCRNVAAPRSTEIRDYYRSHRDELWTPEKIHASHIVKHFENGNAEELRAAIVQVRERLIGGEDFAAIAATFSDCPENGGDLGFFARGVMVPEFDAAVFDAPLHQITPVFETQFGLHVAVVHERRPEGIPQLTAVAAEIGATLHRVKQDREVGRRLAELREKAIIREVAQ
jgi:hypothetical protein